MARFGFNGPIKEIWEQLDSDGSGVISFDELAPEAAKAINTYKDLLVEKHGSIVHWLSELRPCCIADVSYNTPPCTRKRCCLTIPASNACPAPRTLLASPSWLHLSARILSCLHRVALLCWGCFSS